MKVIVKSRPEDKLDEFDYRDYLEITIDGKRAFRVSDGEPEDSNLGRDFSDCMSIPDLMQMAYDAGMHRDDLDITWVEE
jgi:hypothetical protein